MKCEICGGNLNFSDGLYRCESCNASFNNHQAFENIETFICCTELDELGRKTKDSLIANKIYDKLENKGINAFYSRISLDGIQGNNYDDALKNALFYAKIVIVVATTKNRFIQLLNKLKSEKTHKIVLPVYVDMSATDLPDEFKKIQALNYNRIGALEDIVLNVFELLGKSEQLNIERIYIAKKNKQRNAIKIISGILVAIFLMTGAWLVFFSPYVLKPNKYKYAKKFIDDKCYIKALCLLDELNNYKDSDRIKTDLLEKYMGYYNDEIQKISLSIKNLKSDSVNIVCKYEKGNFDVTIGMKNYVAEFKFRDSKGNNGNGELTFQDTGLLLNLKFDSLDEINVLYKLENREDSTVAEINEQTLCSWISKYTTINMLRDKGYDFEYKSLIHSEFGAIYKLKDSAIEVLASAYWDVTQGSAGFADNPLMADFPIAVVSAPAQILLKDKIGDRAVSTFKNDIIYVPNGSFPYSSAMAVYALSDKYSTIGIDTPVYITKENHVTIYGWESMLEEVSLKERQQYNSRLSVIDTELGFRFKELKESYGDVKNTFNNNGALCLNFKNKEEFLFCFDDIPYNTQSIDGDSICTSITTIAEVYFKNFGSQCSISKLQKFLNVTVESKKNETNNSQKYSHSFSYYRRGKRKITILGDSIDTIEATDIVIEKKDND